MITLFETFDNKYKHDSIIIKVDNADDSKVFQELAFTNGLSWINGGETEYLPYPKNGGCLLLSLDKGNISFNDRLPDLMSFLKMSGRNYDKTVYERKDLRTIENILKHGSAGPSYNPRKITRTLESLNNIHTKNIDIYDCYYFNHYNTLFVRLTSDDYVGKTYDAFREFLYKMCRFFNVQFPYYDRKVFEEIGYQGFGIYIRFSQKRGYMEFSYGSMSKLETISFENNLTYLECYTCDQVIKYLDNILLYGKMIVAPSYEPRKITRTLESVLGIEPYVTAVFKVTNAEENVVCQKELIKQGLKWDYGKDDVRTFMEDDYPIYIFAETIYGKVIEHMREDSCKDYGGINGYIDRCIKEGERIVRKVFNYNDAVFLDKILKDGMAVPSYAPRRITRTLEAVEYKERYTVAVRVEDISDIMKVRKEMDKIEVFHSYNEAAMVIDLFPNWLFIDLTWDPKDIYMNYWSNNGEYEYNLNAVNGAIRDDSHADKHIYTVGEISLLISVIKKYFGFPGAPSYAPRKITRTLESMVPEGYKYEGLVVKANAVSDIRKIVDYFYNKYDIESDKNFEEVVGAFEVLYGDWNNTYMLVMLKDKEFMIVSERMVKTYIKMFELNPTIYTVEDLKNFNRNLEVGPSYAPRKITRTLESFQNKYKYEIINIRVDNPEESEKFQRLCFKNEIAWSSGSLEPLYLEWEFPDYLEVSLGKYFNVPCISHGSEVPTSNGIDDGKMDRTIYTIKDYNRVKSIIEKGVSIIAPTYMPRKINRTLESINEALKLIEDNNIARAQNTPPKFYMGDVVTFNPDSIKIQMEKKLYTVEDEEYIKNWMKENIGKELLVDCLAYDAVTNDWLIYVKAYRKSFFIHQDAVMFGAKPTYTPRKINRTL